AEKKREDEKKAAYEAKKAEEDKRAAEAKKRDDDRKAAEAKRAEEEKQRLAYPREAPPAPRRERARARAGYVFIPGRWEWKGGKWEWAAGREEAARPGKKWNEGKWEKKGDQWTFVDGSWADDAAAAYPREAPPAPRTRRPRAGQVIVGARWEWKGGKWEWNDGREEAERPGKKFRDGRWEKKGDQWSFVDGAWEDDAAAAYPREAPPAPRARRPRAGQVIVGARWEWKGGKWEWNDGREEAERPGKKFRDGRWEKRGDQWAFVDGDWEDDLTAFPRQAPPAPRNERPRARPGYVFIPGRWDWKNGKWEWEAGRTEPERAGKKWREGRWEKKGDVYAFVDGAWDDDVAAYPREAPPAPRADNRRARRGDVLIPGRGDWRGGKWEWIDGREEAERPGKRFREGRWEKRGDQWAFVDGDWEDGGYPREAPPAPRAENRRARPGYVLVPGRWDWRGGKWEWIDGREEAERPGKRFREGRWEKRGDQWAFTDEAWEDGGGYPREAPPAPRFEPRRARPGHIYISGRWDWRNNGWEWIAGREEAERPGKRFREGRWERRGDQWSFVDGTWEDGGYPREAPPEPRQERRGARPGFVFIPGRWEWAGSGWNWQAGREEAARPGLRFREGRWESRGDVWTYVDGAWVPEEISEGPDRGQRVERPIVGNFWPPKGKPGTRILISGRNFSSDAIVLWDDKPVRSRVRDSFEIEAFVPTGVSTGTISLRDPARRRDLQVGIFEVTANFDFAAEQTKIDAARQLAAENAIKARKFAAARAAREAAVRARAEEWAAKREQRRADRIAALRTKWANEFLGSEDTQFELTLHAQRTADLHRASEIAELKNDVRLAVRIDVARQREDSRHERRMELLKAGFKGGKP
ncbi:MAG: hypothetical protein K8T90_21050, partial [Planctomycetes bacterium]|nr:hypothetical protein [Planctomycetota bacterium]